MGAQHEGIVLLSNFDKSNNAGYLKWLKARTGKIIEISNCHLTSPTNFGEIYESAIGVIAQQQWLTHGWGS